MLILRVYYQREALVVFRGGFLCMTAFAVRFLYYLAMLVLIALYLGIRGSINLSIKVEFIDNSNEFRELSAGVKFYSSSFLCMYACLINSIIS